jgi:hypothetical protein
VLFTSPPEAEPPATAAVEAVSPLAPPLATRLDDPSVAVVLPPVTPFRSLRLFMSGQRPVIDIYKTITTTLMY